MNTVTATNGTEEPQTESGAAYLQPLSSHCSTSKNFVTKTGLLAGCRCALLTLYSCILLWLAAGPLFSQFGTCHIVELHVLANSNHCNGNVCLVCGKDYLYGWSLSGV